MKDILIMKDKLIIVVIILIVGGVGWGCWQLERKINFTFGYESEVQKMIDTSMKNHINQYHPNTNK